MQMSRRALTWRAGNYGRWVSPNVSSFSCRRRNVQKSGSSLPKATFRPNPPHVLGASVVGDASEAELVANKRRWDEAGQTGSIDNWTWTLNWDQVAEKIIVGSCPRTPEDLDVIVEEAGATAVLSLQSDVCLEALEVDWEAIRAKGASRGVVMARVPIRDFDHGDQTLMLPEAVRSLATMLAFGERVYVHCTAGINRATLTVLGYMTFVQGWELHSALKHIKDRRPQAHPYVDCWKSVKARLLHGRTEEVKAIARHLSKESDSQEKDSVANWIRAEDQVIRETFRRQLDCSLALISSLAAVKSSQGNLSNGGGVSKIKSCDAAAAELARARQEIAALKEGLNGIAKTASAALSGDCKNGTGTETRSPTIEL